MTKKVGIAYGSTELASPVFFSRRGAEEDMYWLTPAPNRIVQVSDDNGIECPPGREGELRIQLLDFDCRSYLDDIEAGAKMFRDGFFWPGDVAVSRANGQIRILGRSADVLNVGGQKVAVGPRELAVQQILNAGDVCLFSGVTDTGEEELVVVIQCDQNIPEHRLDQVRRGFPSFKRVRFELLREFPRTGGGMSKVQRSIFEKNGVSVGRPTAPRCQAISQSTAVMDRPVPISDVTVTSIDASQSRSFPASPLAFLGRSSDDGKVGAWGDKCVFGAFRRRRSSSRL